MGDIEERVANGAYEITLNRPAKLNALTVEMYQGIRDALLTATETREADVIVLRAAGRAFCTGGDLDAFLAYTEVEPHRLYAEYTRRYQLQYPFELMLTCPKPVICAVNGPAVAGGLALVLASDIAIAAQTASFGMTEGKIGMSDHYLPTLLRHKIGVGRSLYLGLTANLIAATTAERWGLVHEVVPDDELEARTWEVVQEVRRTGPNARAAYKRAVGTPTPLVHDAGPTVAAVQSPEAREGISAFTDGRRPEWDTPPNEP